MKTIRFIPLLVLLPLFLCATARAQRYLPRMGGITVNAGLTEKAGFYVDAGYSTYTRRKHHWNFGLNYLQNTDRHYNTKLPLSQLTGEGGFYLRVLQGPRRSFYLSFGVDGIFGYEWVNWSRYRLADGALITDRSRFVFGGALGMEMEYYLNDRYVLLLRVREKILGNSTVGWFHTEAGLGLKIMIR